MKHLISGKKYLIFFMWFDREFNTMLVDTSTFIISIMGLFILCKTHGLFLNANLDIRLISVFIFVIISEVCVNPVFNYERLFISGIFLIFFQNLNTVDN